MSARHPYMPLYIADYERDTRHLTPAEDGLYCRLIRALWEAGGKLPADEDYLARTCRVSLKIWRHAAATVMAFFRVENGLISQKRVTLELAKAERKSRQASEAGKASRIKAAESRIDSRVPARRTSIEEKPLENNECSSTPVPTRAPARSTCARLASLGGSGTESPTGDLFDSSLRSESLPEASSGRIEKEQDVEFEKRFWPAYPQKVGKGQARKAWRTARRSATVDAILAGLERYKQAKPAERDWRYPATWLNGEGWLDEIAAPPKPSVNYMNGGSGFEGRKDRSALFQRMREGTL